MYLDFFNLKENPFNVTSDPNFLYLSHTHEEALNHLIYGIEMRKGFIEITGEIGAGKTTLCRAFLNRLDSNTKTSLIFNSSLPETQLLEAIIVDFGITPERRNKGTIFRQINEFLLKQLSLNNNVVLIIDEAQNLRKSTLETIRMLSNLETEKEKLLQIVLVGQPELKEKLNSPELLQLKQRLSIRFHIKALENDEVKSYINHRLKVAGNDSGQIFSDEAMDFIASSASGIPRVINLLCDKALLTGFVSDSRYITLSIAQRSVEELQQNSLVTMPV